MCAKLLYMYLLLHFKTDAKRIAYEHSI